MMAINLSIHLSTSQYDFLASFGVRNSRLEFSTHKTLAIMKVICIKINVRIKV